MGDYGPEHGYFCLDIFVSSLLYVTLRNIVRMFWEKSLRVPFFKTAFHVFRRLHQNDGVA